VCTGSVAPTIVERTSSRRRVGAAVTETAVLHCDATSVPSPAVTWLVNGQLLDRTDQRYSITRDGRTLTVGDLRVSDAGRYSCVAQNSAGTDERDFYLDVLGNTELALLLLLLLLHPFNSLFSGTS